MIIDGQKWACEACIRGHRVSTCKHHDRPLIRINKKGRPYTMCCVCHCSPCKAPEEHTKLRREAEMQSSKRATGRDCRASTAFVPIAPRPTNLSSSAEQIQNASKPITNNTSTKKASGAGHPVDPALFNLGMSGTTGPCQSEALCPPALSDISTSPPSPLPSTYLTDFQFSEDTFFPDNAFSCLEDMDAVPEDWSSFLWSCNPDMQSGQEMSWQWQYPDPS